MISFQHLCHTSLGSCTDEKHIKVKMALFWICYTSCGSYTLHKHDVKHIALFRSSLTEVTPKLTFELKRVN